jgi:transposase-like protein
MGRAIAVRRDYTSGRLRRLAQRTKNAAEPCRLLAIAAVLDGASREEAAKIGGMDRQALRDWVIRFNEQGPDGFINIPSPGAPAKLDETHKAFLARIVEDGPIPAIHPADLGCLLPRGPVKHSRDCQQPARLRRILRSLREPPKRPARVVPPHRNSLAHGKRPSVCCLESCR